MSTEQQPFQWTDSLVAEFTIWSITNAPTYQGRYTDMEEFKKLKSPPKQEPEPIRVLHFAPGMAFRDESGKDYPYGVLLSQVIPPEKYEPIKKAIEGVLNDEPLWSTKRSLGIVEYPEGKFLTGIEAFNTGYAMGHKDANKYGLFIDGSDIPKHTDAQLLEAEQKSFYAAQGRDTSRGYDSRYLEYPARYPTFADYKQQKS